jgi:hypothetical protein
MRKILAALWFLFMGLHWYLGMIPWQKCKACLELSEMAILAALYCGGWSIFFWLVWCVLDVKGHLKNPEHD